MDAVGITQVPFEITKPGEQRALEFWLESTQMPRPLFVNPVAQVSAHFPAPLSINGGGHGWELGIHWPSPLSL